MIDDSDVVLLGKNNHSPVRRFRGVGGHFTPLCILPIQLEVWKWFRVGRIPVIWLMITLFYVCFFPVGDGQQFRQGGGPICTQQAQLVHALVNGGERRDNLPSTSQSTPQHDISRALSQKIDLQDVTVASIVSVSSCRATNLRGKWM